MSGPTVRFSMTSPMAKGETALSRDRLRPCSIDSQSDTWVPANAAGARAEGTKSRKAKSGRVKTASGFLTALAKRPALLLACGAGIGLIIGALVATHRGSAPAVAAKPAVGSEVAAVTAPPQPPKVAPSHPVEAPTPAPNAGTPATPPPASAGRPAWQQYAKAVPVTEGRPMIAIVIDDMGIDKADSARVIDLPPGITIAFMTYAKDLARQAAAARAAGHELWLHVPMEPLDGELDAGPHVLKTSLTPEENRQRLDWALAQLDGYVGINNHMGSRFTSSEADMKPVLAEVKARGLAFLDSRTTAATVAGAWRARWACPISTATSSSTMTRPSRRCGSASPHRGDRAEARPGARHRPSPRHHHRRLAQMAADAEGEGLRPGAGQRAPASGNRRRRGSAERPPISSQLNPAA